MHARSLAEVIRGPDFESYRWPGSRIEYGHKSSQRGLRLGFVSAFPSSPRSSPATGLVEFHSTTLLPAKNPLRVSLRFSSLSLSLPLVFRAFLSIADDLSTPLGEENCRQTEHSRVNDFPMRRPLMATYEKTALTTYKKPAQTCLTPFIVSTDPRFPLHCAENV